MSTSTKSIQRHENAQSSSMLDHGLFGEDGGSTRTNGEISRPISMFCRQAITRCNALFITSATDEKKIFA